MVVAVPTQAGLIIAADKRTTPEGIYCDGVNKILFPKKAEPIAVFVTGLNSFRDTSGIPRPELCNVLANTPAPVDFGRTVAGYVGGQSNGVAQLDLQGVTEAIYAEMKPYIDSGWFTKLFGTRLAVITMADFEPKTGISNIKSLAVELGPKGEFRFQPSYYERFEMTNRPNAIVFGEGAYFLSNVLNGLGKKFLDRSRDKLTATNSISEVDAELGSAVAINSVEAASKTADIVKPSTGIGGGVDCVLLGLENKVLR